MFPARKKIESTKFKYSPQKSNSTKHNQVFVKEFKFGLLSLYLKKGNNTNEDAYFKDFVDKIENDPELAEKLNIIKFAYVRDSSKCNLPKIQGSGYKSRQIIGIAPQEEENNAEYRKAWAEKIVHYLNNDIKWKYDNVFKFKADVTIICDDKVNSSLDECFLDEDIGGFVGAYLYDSLETIKHNDTVMKAIFGHEENLEMGQTILLANWNNWEPEN